MGILADGVSMTPKEIEVYRQCYRETVEFIMNEFKLTTEEACQYINVNPFYSLGIRIKANKLLIETNLNRNGQRSN